MKKPLVSGLILYFEVVMINYPSLIKSQNMFSNG